MQISIGGTSRTGMRLAITVAAVVCVLGLRARPLAQEPATPGSGFPINTDRVALLARAWTGHARYVPGELLVKFRSSSRPVDQSRALTVLRGGVTSSESRWVGDVLVLKTPGEPDAEVAAAILARQPEIEIAQPNYLRPLRTIPNDPGYPRQWNFDLIDLPRAWDINPGATVDVKVAVIDSGFNTVTQTFAFPLWTGARFETVAMPFAVNPDVPASRIGAGRDFVFWSGPVLDFDGHGTHVAATILEETNNALAEAGIAYKATLMPLKACVGYWELMIAQAAQGIPGFVDPDDGFCDDAAIIAAIRFAADNGAQVINMSFGGADRSGLMLDAMRYAVGKGSFLAMAAGNEFNEGNPVEYPAGYAPQVDGAMSVGSVGRSSRRAVYSNTGSHLEIVAPGGDDTDGGSEGLVLQFGLFFPDFAPAVIRPRFTQYANIAAEGTSMATPHVSGVAALLYSQGIKNPAAIEAAIKHFAKDLGTAGRDNEYGAGLIQARAALRGMGVVR